MKALLFTGKGQMELVNKEVPAVKPGHALIKILASGICGTDTELLLPKDPPNPTVPGHEGVGQIVETGEGCKLKVGDIVMLDCHIVCRKCHYCLAGDEIFCSELVAIGHELDGTNEEYILMPEASLRPLPDDISIEAGVLIGDALGTPYHAVKKADIKPGDYVTVFGAGPLGTMAMFCASCLGAHVIAIDLNETRLETAKNYGVEYCINAKTENVVERVLEITGGVGANSCIQCTPSGIAINNALNSLKLRGILVQVGVCRNVTIDPMAQINDREITIRGSRNFNANELKELIDFVREHREVDKIVTHYYRLDDARAAFDMALSGKGLKILIIPDADALNAVKKERGEKGITVE